MQAIFDLERVTAVVYTLSAECPMTSSGDLLRECWDKQLISTLEKAWCSSVSRTGRVQACRLATGSSIG